MTNPESPKEAVSSQTEARAIAWRGEYKQPGTDRWIVRYVDDGEPKGKNWRNVTPLVDATALAAKDAELADAKAIRESREYWRRTAEEWSKRAERAEAQLAEANKALDEIEKPGVGASPDWSLEECERYWFSQARKQRQIARRAREAQGGE